MKILAIDIGVINFSMVESEVDDFDRAEVIVPEEIIFCELINIRSLVEECTDPSCKLYHEKTMCDYMGHLFQEYEKIFNEVDIILIERQPLQGILSVQELILREYRSKTKLISPNSVHNYLGIGNYTKYMSKEQAYEKRKVYVTNYANKYLSGFKHFCFNERKHDMADAFCIMYYYLTLKREEHSITIKRAEFEKSFGSVIKKIESYRYIPEEDECKKRRVVGFSQYRYTDTTDSS